jgi:hypothetical protein
MPLPIENGPVDSLTILGSLGQFNDGIRTALRLDRAEHWERELTEFDRRAIEHLSAAR